jgi:hypothetical protein
MQFDFLLGFSGGAVVPSTVVPTVVNFLSRVYLRRDDIFRTFKEAFRADHRVASLTPINLVIKHQGVLQSWQMVWSQPERMWGLEPRCGNPGCNGSHDSVRYKRRKATRGVSFHDYAKCVCNKCQWVSDWVRRPDWLVPLGGFYFIHEYPLDEVQKTVISSTMHPPNPPNTVRIT